MFRSGAAREITRRPATQLKLRAVGHLTDPDYSFCSATLENRVFDQSNGT